jgi:phosphatidate cytidylyltransferase
MFRQRAFSSIMIVASAVVPAVLGHPILTIALVALAVFGIIEFCRAVEITGSSAGAGLPVILGALLILSVGFGASAVIISAILVVGFLSLLTREIGRQDLTGSTRDWAYSTVAVLYVSVPLAHVPLIRDFEHENGTAGWLETVNGWALTEHPATGLGWLVLIVAVTWLTDTAAYLGGRALGKHKLAPRLSPGKTIEGAASGVIIGTLAGWLVVYAFELPLPAYAGLLIGLLLSIVGQIGDLAESLIKRDLGVKDMGNVIPGHGGILDRIDALLFTLPVGYYLIRVATEITWP